METTGKKVPKPKVADVELKVDDGPAPEPAVGAPSYTDPLYGEATVVLTTDDTHLFDDGVPIHVRNNMRHLASALQNEGLFRSRLAIKIVAGIPKWEMVPLTASQLFEEFLARYKVALHAELGRRWGNVKLNESTIWAILATVIRNRRSFGNTTACPPRALQKACIEVEAAVKKAGGVVSSESVHLKVSLFTSIVTGAVTIESLELSAAQAAARPRKKKTAAEPAQAPAPPPQPPAPIHDIQGDFANI
jgi:hypothetical protein